VGVTVVRLLYKGALSGQGSGKSSPEVSEC